VKPEGYCGARNHRRRGAASLIQGGAKHSVPQLIEPPYTDPYVRWWGRGCRKTGPPIPIRMIDRHQAVTPGYAAATPSGIRRCQATKPSFRSVAIKPSFRSVVVEPSFRGPAAP